MGIQDYRNQAFSIPVTNLTADPVALSVTLVRGRKMSVNWAPYETVQVDRDLIVQARETFQYYRRIGKIWYDDNVEIKGDEIPTASGSSGATGVQGSTGVQGVTGTFGVDGVTGVQGQTGTQGTTGVSGGATGVRGQTGVQGTTGVSGGATGLQGATGVQGITGANGATGVQGITGAQGITGVQGITGANGATGVQGITGTGVDGVTGVQGITGTSGVDGVTGVQGSTGVQGTTGPGNSLKQKAGVVAGALFTGSPKTALVTFITPFPTATYSVTITGEANRSFTYQSRTTTGFVINANANAAFATDVSWQAELTGETT